MCLLSPCPCALCPNRTVSMWKTLKWSHSILQYFLRIYAPVMCSPYNKRPYGSPHDGSVRVYTEEDSCLIYYNLSREHWCAWETPWFSGRHAVCVSFDFRIFPYVTRVLAARAAVHARTCSSVGANPHEIRDPCDPALARIALYIFR